MCFLSVFLEVGCCHVQQDIQFCFLPSSNSVWKFFGPDILGGFLLLLLHHTSMIKPIRFLTKSGCKSVFVKSKFHTLSIVSYLTLNKYARAF